VTTVEVSFEEADVLFDGRGVPPTSYSLVDWY